MNTGFDSCFFLVSPDMKTIRLNPRQPITIGREKYNDLVLNDLLVSRQHAMIQWDTGHFFLKDLSSRNGTFLNNKRIDFSPLKDGDIIKIGGYEAIVRKASEMDIEKMLLKERGKISSQVTVVDTDLGIRFSDKGFSGDLMTLTLTEVVQTLSQCLKTGLLLVEREDKSTPTANLYFKDGEILHAVYGDLIGSQAVVAILNLTQGQYEFKNDVFTDVRTVSEPTMGILLEACRQIDEAHHYDTDD
ncbi:FHA domain-containing protein [bacterium]|nr:FHA domain-containing protein [candidate division CSSED10-310 bacterium]